MKPRILLSAVCTMLSLAAYTKSNLETENSRITENGLNNEEQFAKTLAIALKNNGELSSFLVDEASMTFDGDNNFLIAPNSNQPSTKGGQSLRDMLKASFPATKSSNLSNCNTSVPLKDC